MAAGVVAYYDTLPELREQVHLHVTNVISGRLASEKPESMLVAQDVITAPKPDVRVTTTPAVIAPAMSGARPVLEINIANHSPMPVFIAAIILELTDGRTLFPKTDVATGQLAASPGLWRQLLVSSRTRSD